MENQEINNENNNLTSEQIIQQEEPRSFGGKFVDEYKQRISDLSPEELKRRDVEYLKPLSDGRMQGPHVPYSALDKPWLANYTDEQITTDTPDCCVFDYLMKCIKKGSYYDKCAINYFGTKVSYEQLIKEHVIPVAKSLKSLGLKKGDTISLCLPACPEATYIFFAANMLGIVCNIIDPRITADRIEACIGNNSKALFSIDVFNDKIEPIAKKLNVPTAVNVSASESLPLKYKALYKIKKHNLKFPSMMSWKDFNKLSNNVNEITSVNEPEEPAAIIYTSGTTGVPKAAKLSNKNVISVAEGQKYSLPGITPGDKFLQIMPPFIAYGLVCGMCASLASGLELIVIPKFAPSEFNDLVLKHKPNIIMGVPSFFEEFTKSEKVANTDLSFIKYMIAGGDKTTVESERMINDFVLSHGAQNKLVKGYGMTEVSSAATINNDNAENVLGSVGKPMVKNSVRIVNPETGEDLPYIPSDVVEKSFMDGLSEEEKAENNNLIRKYSGEIYIKSESAMMGYVNNPEEENKVFVYDDNDKSYWVKTGDLGYVDNKGNVTIIGRLKRMIVRPDGHNVWPATIEDSILKHPAVDKCVVVGSNSTETLNGKIATACVVLKPEYKGQEEEIKSQLMEMTLNDIQNPRDVAERYLFVDSIDLTPIGKVDYQKLEQIANEEFASQRTVL